MRKLGTMTEERDMSIRLEDGFVHGRFDPTIHASCFTVLAQSNPNFASTIDAVVRLKGLAATKQVGSPERRHCEEQIKARLKNISIAHILADALNKEYSKIVAKQVEVCTAAVVRSILKIAQNQETTPPWGHSDPLVRKHHVAKCTNRVCTTLVKWWRFAIQNVYRQKGQLLTAADLDDKVSANINYAKLLVLAAFFVDLTVDDKGRNLNLAVRDGQVHMMIRYRLMQIREEPGVGTEEFGLYAEDLWSGQGLTIHLRARESSDTQILDWNADEWVDPDVTMSDADGGQSGGSPTGTTTVSSDDVFAKMVESVPDKIIIDENRSELVQQKMNQAALACNYLFQNLRGETLGMGKYRYHNSIYNRSESREVKWPKCDMKLIWDLRTEIFKAVGETSAGDRHFSFSAAYEEQNFDAFEKNAVQLAQRALEGWDGIDAVIASAGQLWRPVADTAEMTRNVNHFHNRREIMVEFPVSPATVWGFRPRDADGQEKKYDPSYGVHTTCIANVHSITAMGLQAGAGQKQSVGVDQEPAVYFDEYTKFSRSTWYGPLCHVPAAPDVLARVCYVFQIDPAGYRSTGDQGKKKVLPGFMRPVKILVCLNHINDICDGQRHESMPNKGDEYSNIAYEVFEKFGVKHDRKSNDQDLSWLSVMKDKYKVDQSSIQAHAMAPPPPPPKKEVKREASQHQ